MLHENGCAGKNSLSKKLIAKNLEFSLELNTAYATFEILQDQFEDFGISRIGDVNWAG